jgi:hypothetical protein
MAVVQPGRRKPSANQETANPAPRRSAVRAARFSPSRIEARANPKTKSAAAAPVMTKSTIIKGS